MRNGEENILETLMNGSGHLIIVEDMIGKLATELGRSENEVRQELPAFATLIRHGQQLDALKGFTSALWPTENRARRRLPFVDDKPEPEPLPFVRAIDLSDDPVEYLFADLLVCGGTSLLAGEPKAGKSHLARCLALSAARGDDYLGRHMSAPRRSVLLMCLEETSAQVRSHLDKLGMNEQDDNLHVYIPKESPPRDLPARLAVAVDRLRPNLVVVDTLQKLLHIADVSDYAKVESATTPLADLARMTGAHITALHHTRKSGGQGGTEVLGSTGLSGAVDTVLVLRCDEGGQRTLYSRNRSGVDLPETLLQLDDDGGWVRTTGTKAAAEARNLEHNVLTFLAEKGEAMGADEIITGLHVGRNAGKAALEQLVENGLLMREGKGSKGSKFLYSVPDPKGSTEYGN